MQWSSISRKSSGVWIAAAAMAALILGSSGGPTPFHRMNVRLGRHGLARIHGRRSDQSWESDNWSGYAIAAPSGSLPTGSVTMASASWIVPAATCTVPEGTPNSYASFWVGIDGWTSNTVEQIGTDSDCAGNSPSYYAWFEFYPSSAYYIGNPSNNFAGYVVQPLDVISAQVSATGNGNFTAIMTDTRSNVQQWKFSTTGHARGAQQSSAEWIAEAPCCGRRNTVLPLANFGMANYGDDYTFNAQTSTATVPGLGIAGPIGSFGQYIQESTMVSQGARGGSSSGTTMAQPTNLSSDGTSFQIEWYNSGP